MTRAWSMVPLPSPLTFTTVVIWKQAEEARQAATSDARPMIRMLTRCLRIGGMRKVFSNDALLIAVGVAVAVSAAAWTPGSATRPLSAQAPSGAAAKDVTVLGFKLHYLEAGRGAPVVLLHGLGRDGSRWGPNIEPLARDFNVFALDQIGFGESDKPLANYHTGMLAEFLVGFLKAAGIPKASLVGNSMGAG